MSPRILTRILRTPSNVATLAAAAALVTGGLSTLGPVESAHAAPTIDVTCASTATNQYSPPLTLTIQPTTLTTSGALSNCLDTSGRTPTVVSGTFTATYTLQASCEDATGGGIANITWNLSDGSTDTSTITVTSPAQGGATGVTAVVTAGRFAGDSMLGLTLRNPNPDLLQCASGGLSTDTRTGTAVFEHP